jgi:hypothetical protein
MKQKVAIFLISFVAILLGIIIGKFFSNSAPTQNPADDGKLAQNYKEKVLVKAIYDNAKDLQKCYFGYLDKKPSVTAGVMNILIKVEENGRISSAEVTKNEFQDNNFASCISKKLESYFLAPPPLGINRYIAHVLAFKSEAEALKEAKERAEKNKPPKMLPIGQE